MDPKDNNKSVNFLFESPGAEDGRKLEAPKVRR